MCGFAGLVDLDGIDQPLERRRLQMMTDAIAHRGPDEEGHHLDSHAALGHRRLSIIDCAAGQQPLGNEDGTVLVVFNGEIYNYLDLRDWLLSRGHDLATTSDTEVIVHLYEELGEGCVERLWGMFAFALWDRASRKLLLARDRVGKKPLYFALRNRRLSFASELKSLIAGELVSDDIDLEALDCYFTLGYIPSPLSIFEEVRKLEPAHHLVFDGDGIRKSRYWELSFEPGPPLSMAEAEERLEALLSQSVGCRLMSEVPLGAFLSGGIDSSLIVSEMARLTNEPVKTASIGFDVSRYDELPHARAVASVFGTEHTEHVVRPDAIEALGLLSWHFDEPLADPSAIPTYYVCKMARQKVTVALSGDGGDEPFGGYTFRYRPHLIESQLRAALPAAIRGLAFGIAGQMYPKWDWLPRPLRLKTILSNLAASDANAFYLDLALMSPAIREALYARSFVDQLRGFTPHEAVAPLYAASDAPDPMGRAQHADIQSYMTEDVLVKVDRLSMAVSLEVRCPLLDHRVLEFAARLPLELKLKGGEGKRLLRQLASRRVPRDIVERPKQGFSPPVSEWLRGELRELAQESLFSPRSALRDLTEPRVVRQLWREHQSGLREHSQILWALLMFRQWEDTYRSGTLEPKPAPS